MLPKPRELEPCCVFIGLTEVHSMVTEKTGSMDSYNHAEARPDTSVFSVV